MIYFPNIWEEGIINAMEPQNIESADQVFYADIYCQIKYRFLMLIFLVEICNTYAAPVSRKLILSSNIQACTYNDFSA